MATPKTVVNVPVYRDEVFYFQDTIFQVENRLFKVPLYVFLQQSRVFQDMFSLPVPEGTKADGTSNDKPLKLDGILETDFIRLLKYLFRTKRSSDSDQTLDEWTSVLKLATMWDMADVKTDAIRRMTPLLQTLPAIQVKLSREHSVEEWLVPGLNRLAQCEKPLKRDDAELIGLDYAVQVMALREECRYNDHQGRWTTQPRGEVSWDFSKLIKARFNIPARQSSAHAPSSNYPC